MHAGDVEIAEVDRAEPEDLQSSRGPHGIVRRFTVFGHALEVPDRLVQLTALISDQSLKVDGSCSPFLVSDV